MRLKGVGLGFSVSAFSLPAADPPQCSPVTSRVSTLAKKPVMKVT